MRLEKCAVCGSKPKLKKKKILGGLYFYYDCPKCRWWHSSVFGWDENSACQNWNGFNLGVTNQEIEEARAFNEMKRQVK